MERPASQYDLAAAVQWPNFTLRTFPVRQRKGLGGKLGHLLQPYRNFFSRELRTAMREELCKNPDVIHLEQTWCGWLALACTERALLNVHYLRGIDTQCMRNASWKAKLNHRLAVRAEIYLIRRYRHVRVLSSRLAEEVRRIHPTAQVHQITFGTDSAHLTPLPVVPHVPTIGITGDMRWEPSYAAARVLLTEVWPRLRETKPSLRLLICGWSARRKFSEFVGSPGVEIHEDVPDIRIFLAQIDVFVCPSFGATGTKTKIIEAMQLGIPIVTTQEGLEGLPAMAGVHAAVGETYLSLAERAAELLNDPIRARNLAEAARDMVGVHCSPGKTVSQLEGAYDLVTQGVGQ
jgi:glycosyltransferase involved in cell wall biosynthesis